jgi:hypothetical protein
MKDTLALSNGQIANKVATFAFERYDSVMHSLAERGWARFEVSPYADGTSSGVVWSKFMDSSSPMLILDAAVGAESCAGYDMQLVHLGLGVQRRGVGGAASFVAMKRAVNNLVAIPDAAWATGSFDVKRPLVSELENVIRRSQEGGESFPLLGYPVVGVYELRAGVGMRECLLDQRPRLTVKLVFANQSQ